MFNAAEQAADQHLQETAGQLTALGLTVEAQQAAQPQLQGWAAEGYTLWLSNERFQVAQSEQEALALLGEDWYWADGWLHHKAAASDQLVVKAGDPPTATVLSAEDATALSFPVYARYVLDDGMTSYPEMYWPQDLAMLIGDCVNTGQDWIFQRDEVARQYVEALGDEAVSITVVEDDLSGTGAAGTVALLEVETAGGEQLQLLLQEVSADTVNPNFAPERYWQMVGYKTADGGPLYSDIPLPIFYDWLSPEDQVLYWQLSRSWYTVESSPETADFALQNGAELGMTAEEVAQCLGGTPGPYSAYLHMGGSMGFDYDQIGYNFYHTPEGEQLISLRLPAEAALTASSTGFDAGSTVSDVLAALGYPNRPLRSWAQDILYGDPSPDGQTDRFAYLSYSTILGRYAIYRKEGPVSVEYTFNKDDTLNDIDLRLGAKSFLGTLGAPVPPEGGH